MKRSGYIKLNLEKLLNESDTILTDLPIPPCTQLPWGTVGLKDRYIECSDDVKFYYYNNHGVEPTELILKKGRHYFLSTTYMGKCKFTDTTNITRICDTNINEKLFYKVSCNPFIRIEHPFLWGDIEDASGNKYGTSITNFDLYPINELAQRSYHIVKSKGYFDHIQKLEDEGYLKFINVDYDENFNFTVYTGTKELWSSDDDKIIKRLETTEYEATLCLT